MKHREIDLNDLTGDELRELVLRLRNQLAGLNLSQESQSFANAVVAVQIDQIKAARN